MTREQFIKKRKYLFWYVKHPEKVNDEALVEAVLNLGNWDDVQKLFKLLGIKKVAKVFKKETSPKRMRINYRPEVKNFFSLYFKRHAQ
ncbi:MAG: hypothetical protein WCV59_01710 [Parcubacteria group bacterium]|jgi:hypothetical protein